WRQSVQGRCEEAGRRVAGHLLIELPLEVVQSCPGLVRLADEAIEARPLALDFRLKLGSSRHRWRPPSIQCSRRDGRKPPVRAWLVQHYFAPAVTRKLAALRMGQGNSPARSCRAPSPGTRKSALPASASSRKGWSCRSRQCGVA